jgi:hypothetical protein
MTKHNILFIGLDTHNTFTEVIYIEVQQGTRKIALVVSCGSTRKGVWRSAKTKGINQALSNQYLTNAGLLSLRGIWVKNRSC